MIRTDWIPGALRSGTAKANYEAQWQDWCRYFVVALESNEKVRRYKIGNLLR